MDGQKVDNVIKPLLPDVPIHQVYESDYTGVYVMLGIIIFITIASILSWNIITPLWCSVGLGMWIPTLLYFGIMVIIHLLKKIVSCHICKKRSNIDEDDVDTEPNF